MARLYSGTRNNMDFLLRNNFKKYLNVILSKKFQNFFVIFIEIAKFLYKLKFSYTFYENSITTE